MWADQSGQAVQPIRPIALTVEACERFRDILAIQLRAKRIPHKSIARILGMRTPNLRQRLARMPHDARERYRKLSLAALVK